MLKTGRPTVILALAIWASGCAKATPNVGDAGPDLPVDVVDAADMDAFDPPGDPSPDWPLDPAEDPAGDETSDLPADTAEDAPLDLPVDAPVDTPTDPPVDPAVDTPVDPIFDPYVDRPFDPIYDPYVDPSTDPTVEDIAFEPPPGCGDGVLGSGEACDDGSANSLLPDACRPDCTLPSCGDGTVDTGESCDGGAWPKTTPGAEGATCRTTHDCATSAPICSSAGTCQDGSLGDSCTTDFDCASTTAGCIDGQCRSTRCPGTLSTEVCDGIDNDCDGTVDETCPYSCTRDDRPIIDRLDSCRRDCTLETDQLFVPCGAVYEMSGTRSYSGTVTINGWVTLPALSGGTGGSLEIHGTDVVVAGYIDCTAVGHPQGAGPGGSSNGNGGSYGGLGGISGHGSGDPRGPTYGTLDTRIISMGSGGGPSAGYGGGSGGGTGGGSVHIVGDTVNVSGIITCDGGDATATTSWAAGGGSGGGILVESTTTVAFTGTASAQGGDGVTGTWAGAGGGGGRIKLFAGTTGSSSGSVDVSGGSGATGTYVGGDGAAGTTYRNF